MKRILIVRLSAIGDCIQTMPLAVALKHHWPDCYVSWVVDCAAEQLLRNHPSVDQVIRLKKGFAGRPRDLQMWYRNQRRRHDVVIDPQGLFKSAILGTLTRASQRIGFANPIARELSWLSYTDRVRPPKGHLIQKQLSLLGPLGIALSSLHADKPDFGWRDDPSEETWGMQTLASMGLQPHQYFVVNPGAGWPSKLWPTVKYVEVVQRLFDNHRLPSLIVWAGEQEKQLAREIVDGAPHACQLAPDTRLRQLAWLLGRSRLFLGSDTGPMHLAVAVGCPTVALFGPTDPAHCGPLGSIHRALRVSQPSSQSQPIPKGMRKADNRQMNLITSEMVLEACHASLNDGPIRS